MFRSWKLGTAFGIGIYVHWTFLLLPAYVFLGNFQGGHLDPALFAVALIGAVFGCVVLHELGHALMARRFGISTRDITLYPIGGVARLERMSERPWEEFWIALAGPAVNVVIAALLAGVLLLPSAGSVIPEPFAYAGVDGFLSTLMVSNIGLVLFNLLPAFPMDGGRVLRALLATQMGRLRATELATQIGMVIAVVLMFAAVWMGWPFLILGAFFVFFAGQQELAAVRYRAQREPHEALEMRPAHEPHGPTSPFGRGFTGFTWDDHARRWIEWRNGQPVHVVSVE